MNMNIPNELLRKAKGDCRVLDLIIEFTYLFALSVNFKMLLANSKVQIDQAEQLGLYNCMSQSL